jgi:hypothetical protein
MVSGVYSVRIGDAKFKVAQITISNEPAPLSGSGSGSGSRVKRISSQSLEKIAEEAAADHSGKRKSSGNAGHK